MGGQSRWGEAQEVEHHGGGRSYTTAGCLGYGNEEVSRFLSQDPGLRMDDGTAS